MSNFHKMVYTILKMSFQKAKPKEIIYRNYKTFVKEKFKDDLRQKFSCNDSLVYANFESIYLETLDTHAPIKKVIVRANHAPYVTKQMRKAIMKRSALENKFYKNRNAENLMVYKKQRNYCSRLYKNVKNIMLL